MCEAPRAGASLELLERLPSLPADGRTAALESLLHDPSPEIRERVLRLGAMLLTDDQLVGYLRNDDDGALRNAGLEILKARGERSYGLAVHLLCDGEPDVVLQAVLILDQLRNPRALEALRGTLQHPDPNVVQAAITAVGRLGDAAWVEVLLPFLRSDPWLQLAAIQALGDLRASLAVRALAQLLEQPGLSAVAAEALARIGGAAVFRALAAAFLERGDELDAEAMLGLLAHVLEGLRRHPAAPRRLRALLAAKLGDTSVEARRDAARCLLALGPDPLDDQAVEILAGLEGSGRVPPPAVCRRPDLTPRLLARHGTLQAWGFHLAAQRPHAVPAQQFFAALDVVEEADELAGPIARTLSRLRDPRIGQVLLRFFRRLAPESRRTLIAVLKKHADVVRSALATARDVDDATQLVVSSLLGDPPGLSARRVQALPPDQRLAVLEQLADVRPIMRLLPWETWLEEAPAEIGPLAAEVACRTGLRELLPALRQAAGQCPSPPLLRAFGALRDRESAPLLLHLLESRPDLRPVVYESLGRIGGAAVRAALHAELLRCPATEARLLYKALSLCATAEDAPLFHAVIAHRDWYVRLAAAEALGRFSLPENRSALAILAADPVPVVAHRALAVLNG